MCEPHEIRDRLAFSECEIVGRNCPYAKWLQAGPNCWPAETSVIGAPFVGGQLWPHFFFTISRASSEALFRGSDSGTKYAVLFLASRQVYKIIAPETLNRDSTFPRPQSGPCSDVSDLNLGQELDFVSGSENSRANERSDISSLILFSADTTSKGERCIKGTDHLPVHPLVHPRISGGARSQRGCASRNDQIGRGQNTGLGWSDTTFVHVSVPKAIRGVAPAQLRGDRAECLVRVQIGKRTIPKAVWKTRIRKSNKLQKKGGHSNEQRR
jgi:hypothetical protein